MNTAQAIASRIVAIANYIASGNKDWQEKHGEALALLETNLPSGSGIDRGTKIDREASNGEKIVLLCSFHHMNEGGYYDGWTEHKITVRPSFSGFSIKIGGRDRNQIKDYLADVYHAALSEEVK